MKLYEIVDDDTSNAIISWQEPNFDKFIIHNFNSFCQNILPKYFKHGNFSSFIRLLNMYGFHKQNKKKDGQVFFRPFFQKDKKALLHKINRKCYAKQKDPKPQNLNDSDHSKSKGKKKRETKLMSKSL